MSPAELRRQAEAGLHLSPAALELLAQQLERYELALLKIADERARSKCCGGLQSLERGLERCHDCPLPEPGPDDCVLVFRAWARDALNGTLPLPPSQRRTEECGTRLEVTIAALDGESVLRVLQKNRGAFLPR